MKARHQKGSWHSSGRILHYHESKRKNVGAKKIGANKSGDTCGRVGGEGEAEERDLKRSTYTEGEGQNH